MNQAQGFFFLFGRMKFFKIFKYFLLVDFLLLCKNIVIADHEVRNDFHGEERNALMALKATFNDSFLRQNWTSIMCYVKDPPRWHGIQCSSEGRVTGIVLENMGLSGEIAVDVLFNLTELSILSFKDNKISGKLMDFSNNQKLTEIDLSGNRFDGQIPSSLLELNSLASLQLQGNNLDGFIPWFNQSSLREFNVSYNNLSGPIPNTAVLQSFNRLSFLSNPNLCGSPSPTACSIRNDISNSSVSSSSKHSSSSGFAPILLLIVGVIGLVVLLFLFVIYYKKYTSLKKLLKKNHILPEEKERAKDVEKNTEIVVRDQKRVVEGQDRGNLAFMDEETHFELDDLLKASAEGLGKGNFGNCYKAMLENGPTVVVKRLRDLKPLSKEEFVKQLRGIAEQRHPNLLPLLGYYYSKDEKFLLYKFASHGNAYNRLHDGRGKPTRIPFRWSSRFAVARGVARALEYLHMNIKSPNMIPHGNLKLSNVLLDENSAVLVTDFGLTSLIAVSLAAQRMVAYKSPEFQSHKRVSRKSDVRSYGCLLLELLTGRVSADSAPQGADNAVDLCSWVHRAVREEWTAEILDVEIAVQRSASAGMLKLLQIAIRCCERSPELRPEMSEVVREVEKIQVVTDSEDDEEFSSVDRSFTDDSMSARSIGEDQR